MLRSEAVHIPELPGIALSKEFDARKYNLRRAFGRIVLTLAVFGGAAYTNPPLHESAAMLEQVISSDIGAIHSLGVDPPPSSEISDIVDNYRLEDHLFKGNKIGWFASTWPTSVALGALYSASLVRGQSGSFQTFLNSLEAVNQTYWGSVPVENHHGSLGCYNQGPTVFHNPSDAPLIDDNLWMGLLDMRAYGRTKNSGLLTKAEEVFSLARSQWDPNGGGIYWQYQLDPNVSHGKAVVSNANATILGVELYQATGKKEYLDFAEKDYAWVRQTLYDPTTRGCITITSLGT